MMARFAYRMSVRVLSQRVGELVTEMIFHHQQRIDRKLSDQLRMSAYWCGGDVLRIDFKGLAGSARSGELVETDEQTKNG